MAGGLAVHVLLGLVRVGGVVKTIGKGLVSRIREEIWVVGEQRPRITSFVAVARVIMVVGVFPIV
jgi:hypothetical protein